MVWPCARYSIWPRVSISLQDGALAPAVVVRPRRDWQWRLTAIARSLVREGIMTWRIGRWRSGGNRVRSAAAVRRPRRASCGLALQRLEDRVVLSDLSGLPPPATGPAEV